MQGERARLLAEIIQLMRVMIPFEQPVLWCNDRFLSSLFLLSTHVDQPLLIPKEPRPWLYVQRRHLSIDHKEERGRKRRIDTQTHHVTISPAVARFSAQASLCQQSTQFSSISWKRRSRVSNLPKIVLDGTDPLLQIRSTTERESDRTTRTRSSSPYSTGSQIPLWNHQSDGRTHGWQSSTGVRNHLQTTLWRKQSMFCPSSNRRLPCLVLHKYFQ